MNLYREVDYQTEPCQVVGVHPLQWNEHLREPTVGFVEVELDDIPEVRTLRQERDDLKARVAELESHIAATDPWKGEG